MGKWAISTWSKNAKMATKFPRPFTNRACLVNNKRNAKYISTSYNRRIKNVNTKNMEFDILK